MGLLTVVCSLESVDRRAVRPSGRICGTSLKGENMR
jgi:hypothetical protein